MVFRTVILPQEHDDKLRFLAAIRKTSMSELHRVMVCSYLNTSQVQNELKCLAD
ncbi:MAG: hypothetical protein DDT26_00127 [Dehalococcoidia bacterium]|nr:hypothetical protein [Chloroflexota bacterium]